MFMRCGIASQQTIAIRLFARTIDGGATWEPARAIFDPGVGSQTIGNVIAVLQDGTLINYFTQLNSSGAVSTGGFAVMR